MVAADSVGLDSLDISSPEAESSYHTQLSRSEVNTTFKRSFTLQELFPNADQLKGAVTITATVRNTRGAATSATVVVRPAQSK